LTRSTSRQVDGSLKREEEIYFHPSTPFVARFTGLAGEIPVLVTGQGTGAGVIEVVPGGVRSTHAFAAREAKPGAGGRSGRVMIRPGAVTISVLEDESHVLGSVTDLAFRGRGYEHVIDLPGGERIAGVMSENRFDRHSSVGLRLDHAGCHFFADDHSEDAPSLDGEAT
jgi:iron(III) transport system ATP-binding protein